MKEKIKSLENLILDKIKAAESLEALDGIYNLYLSKKGEFSLMMQSLKDYSAEERPIIGKLINDSKTSISDYIQNKKVFLENIKLEANLKTETIDVNLPGTNYEAGSIHPLNLIIEQAKKHFIRHGYEVVMGPEIELDRYNFEMMNLSADHPARDMQDSFYFDPQTLLRTHTSPVQARTMLKKMGKPLKIVCPGKVYRRDEDDQTHSHQFMQIEGLVIGEKISFANLKQALLDMLEEFFNGANKIRIRPSYFPFTEPSVEVDVEFTKKDGTKRFVEILGAGMVHPNVLKMGGYDPEKFSGFAFGVGIERIAMIKYEIDDIRHFYNNDLRFLKQFKEEC